MPWSSIRTGRTQPDAAVSGINLRPRGPWSSIRRAVSASHSSTREPETWRGPRTVEPSGAHAGASVAYASLVAEERFQDRFDPSRYENDEPIEIIAHRQTDRRALVTREQVTNESLFGRIVNLAQAYELHLLPTLDLYGSFELNKQQARALSDEVRFLSGLIDDPLLKPVLSGIGDVADWCWQFSGDAWVRIEGP